MLLAFFPNACLVLASITLIPHYKMEIKTRIKLAAASKLWRTGVTLMVIALGEEEIDETAFLAGISMLKKGRDDARRLNKDQTKEQPHPNLGPRGPYDIEKSKDYIAIMLRQTNVRWFKDSLRYVSLLAACLSCIC